jgi:hypothetical protein
MDAILQPFGLFVAVWYSYDHLVNSFPVWYIHTKENLATRYTYTATLRIKF